MYHSTGPPNRGFYVDFIVEGRVLLELMHVAALRAEHTDLALNYLRESEADVCLLINFGRSPVEIHRILPSGESSVEVLMVATLSTHAISSLLKYG